jgi:hypothetical protein
VAMGVVTAFAGALLYVILIYFGRSVIWCVAGDDQLFSGAGQRDYLALITSHQAIRLNHSANS